MGRRSSAAARQEHRFHAGMDVPTPVGCTVDRTAGLASPWVQWSNGSVDTCPQGQLRWQLSVILHGQLPPRAPRPSSSTRASSSRRRKVRSCRRARTQRPSLPATPCPRAYRVLSDPHRSLECRRLRHLRPRLDDPRPRARCRGRGHRHQPLRRRQRRLARGTLVPRGCSSGMHVHASDRLLTPTNSL